MQLPPLGVYAFTCVCLFVWLTVWLHRDEVYKQRSELNNNNTVVWLPSRAGDHAGAECTHPGTTSTSFLNQFPIARPRTDGRTSGAREYRVVSVSTVRRTLSSMKRQPRATSFRHFVPPIGCGTTLRRFVFRRNHVITSTSCVH